jgi:hypothetical protein
MTIASHPDISRLSSGLSGFGTSPEKINHIAEMKKKEEEKEKEKEKEKVKKQDSLRNLHIKINENHAKNSS